MVDSAFYGGVHSTPLSLIYADEKRLLGLKITSSDDNADEYLEIFGKIQAISN